MASTEDTLRAKLVDTIQAIAMDDLGFDAPAGNIKDYPLEYEDPALATEYLVTTAGGEKVVRCWSVEVLGNDDWFAAGNITMRTYEITITAYYSPGIRGEGYTLMVTHARKVRGAIRSLGSRLDNLVDLVNSTSALSITKVGGNEEGEGQLLIGQMRYTAQKRNPDF